MILSISIVSPPLYYSKFDIVNLFVPPYKKWTIRFIKALLVKKKLVILLNLSDCSIFRQLQTIKLDDYQSRSTRRISQKWGFVKQITDLLSYFPDLEVNELPDRDFMWSILTTLREEGVKKLIADARKNRDVSNEENKQELIEIHPDFLNALISAPNTNRSNHI